MRPTTWCPGITGDFARRQFSFDNVQVRSAHAARADAHQYFTALRLRHRNVRIFQWIRFNRGWRPQQACFHRATSALSSASNAKQSSAFYLRREILYTRIREPSESFMFTGIIEHTGAIEALDLKMTAGASRSMRPSVAPSLAVSNSIAVNGCCLTIVDLHHSAASADLSGETIRKTSFRRKEWRAEKRRRASI